MLKALYRHASKKKKNPSWEYQTKKIVAGKQDSKLIKGHQRVEK